jgi:exodeoxyribonuclease V alpha subunit
MHGIPTVRSSSQFSPCCLAKDIHGIGFKTADQIVQKIGIPHDSILRACAGLNHVLLEATGQGHCALPVELLRDEAGKLLLVDDKIVTQALERTLACGDLIEENIAGQELLFLPFLKRAEEVIAARITKLCALPANCPPVDVDKAVEWCQRKTGKELAPSQRKALDQALTSRALVITGGPGVGKTTLVNTILLILRAKKVRCLLCAPTGRAAKRLHIIYNKVVPVVRTDGGLPAGGAQPYHHDGAPDKRGPHAGVSEQGCTVGFLFHRPGRAGAACRHAG